MVALQSSKKCLTSAAIFLALLASPVAHAQDLTVAVAASLQDALEAMKTDIAAELPATAIHVSPGASGMIQQQILQGAPIDVFLSAAAKPVNELEQQKQLSPGTLKVFLNNDLVLIAPEKSTLHAITDIKDAKVKRIALGEPRTVPAGDYASQTLKSLKLFDTLTPKFVFGKDVRQVLSYVARGEVDAGFVYKSDLQSAAAKGVKIIEEASADSHDPIQYSMTVIASSKQQDKAKKLLSYFEGPKAAVIWKKFGFQVPTETAAAKGKASAPR
mgnify:CR=1 FL=1